MLSFLVHEYFHHYNVKRIRPFELGPFDYDKGNRTNQLWISEGLTVYYEYLILRRAGLIDTETFLAFMENQINTLENDQGRHHQSLAEASYSTWEDGPFGASEGEDKAISAYNKGTVVGLLLDLQIRDAKDNKKSLDDVMKKLYWHFYKKENRGFTDAEFRRTCEEVTGTSLADLFAHVYTTKDLEYDSILGPVGLLLNTKSDNSGKKVFSIRRTAEPSILQKELLNAWLSTHE